MRSDSTEYLHIPLTTSGDITSFPVGVGFVDSPLDVPETWHDAEHETGGIRILVGDEGGVVPEVSGTVCILVKITANPEIPIIFAGQFQWDTVNAA